MFAREQKQEYDPTSIPVIERPLAKQLQGNAYGGSGLEGLRSAERLPTGQHGNESKSSYKLQSPTLMKTPVKNGLRSPSKDQISPTKSSLATRVVKPKSSFDHENSTWSEENSGDERKLPPGRTLHRHAKSVTFDVAPPQINEYEMATPDLSSIGTGSRENSYDSAEDEDEESYIRGDSAEQDDSFDASLEDTDKTPVVGPEDWRHISPNSHKNGLLSGQFEDPFARPEGSPMPEVLPSSLTDRPPAIRSDSLTSNGDHRPLPPLPGVRQARSNSEGSSGLFAAAERVTSFQRNAPSPPAPSSVSKSEIQGMGGGKMSLEERLRLMMIQDEEKPKSPAELQRERRMRRAGARDRGSQTPEKEQPINIHEDVVDEDDTLDDLAGLGTFKMPPRISRESILRKVNGDEAFSRESDYNFSSPMPSSSPERMILPDPDTPIPSTEDESTLEAGNDSVIIKAEPGEDEVDLYSITEMYHETESRLDEYDPDESVIHHEIQREDDLESRCSDPTPSNQSPQPQSENVSDDTGLPTPRANSPALKNTSSDPVKEDRQSLPGFTSFFDRNDFGLSLQSYINPTPPFPDGHEESKGSRMSMSDAHEYLRRPETPEEFAMPSSKPEYDGSGWGPEEDDTYEVGTPDSVIRNPVPPSPNRDSPSIPEHVATIKSSGSKLKTRPSATPSDIMAMRELRRNVSGEAPSIPPIPERHRSRPSLNLEPSEVIKSDGELERKESFKKKSLTLDIGNDLGLGLDKDFDRVIEAQKVAFDLSLSRSALFHLHNGQASNSGAVPKYDFYANLTPRKQRGYLMRQNTKVVVASSDVGKGSRSVGNSPAKKDRPQSWTVEPWNGQVRQHSMRNRSSPRKNTGPVPPIPGQDSNVTGVGIVNEDFAANEGIPEEGGERGRLFLKVNAVKDLDLPLPKSKISSLRVLAPFNSANEASR
jgi:hypothetical protein